MMSELSRDGTERHQQAETNMMTSVIGHDDPQRGPGVLGVLIEAGPFHGVARRQREVLRAGSACARST